MLSGKIVNLSSSPLLDCMVLRKLALSSKYLDSWACHMEIQIIYNLYYDSISSLCPQFYQTNLFLKKQLPNGRQTLALIGLQYCQSGKGLIDWVSIVCNIRELSVFKYSELLENSDFEIELLSPFSPICMDRYLIQELLVEKLSYGKQRGKFWHVNFVTGKIQYKCPMFLADGIFDLFVPYLFQNKIKEFGF